MSQKSLKFDFKNQQGETLSGRLEMPAITPRAFAIFAHCFTCHKNVSAASRISKNLSRLGIAVLRFDFTGLGNSDGDFSNTNFSSNVEDLIAAYEAIKSEFKAPEIIIGHSLGGAAVLKTAPQLKEVKAVVTIAAPSDTAHVSHLFQCALPEIEASGEAKVKLVGREFKIKKQFVDDIKEQDILTPLSETKKAFLLFHSPLDDTVSIDHAAKIYGRLKHPKSFITLDGADHLVSKVNDAQYIADSINTWVKRYLPEREDPAQKFSGMVLASLRANSKFTTDIYSTNHSLVADEPKKIKGDDLGMAPYELLLSSLGACTVMTLKMYADRKGYKIDDINVDLNHKKIPDPKNENPELSLMIDHIEKRIMIKGDITEEQKARMLEIADKCPINKTLLSKVQIENKTYEF